MSAGEGQTAVPEHLLVQRTIVKMLYDPQFAAAVRSRPDEVIAELSAPRRRELAAVDPRAYQLDPLRRERLLRSLFDELKGSLTLALAETHAWAFLLRFFSSSHFHRAVDGELPAALAMADYLVASTLATPALRPLVAIERGLAAARRDKREPGPPYRRGVELRLAPQVMPVRTTKGALAALTAVEQYLFSASLLPALTLVHDGPGLVLPEHDPTPHALVVVPYAGTLTLVEIDEETLSALLRIAAGEPVDDVALLDHLGESELLERRA